VKPVTIQFIDSNTPYSPLFQDFYYTPGLGIEESSYVYLEGSGFINSLKSEKGKTQFNVGEIGFGVGLNFLLTYRQFLKNSSPSQILTYVTAEKHPVTIEGLQELYPQFPELSEYSKELLEQYPELTPGVHLLNFNEGRVKLVLMLGDAQEMFFNLKLKTEQKIEYWYWDGFSPSKNPDAFQETLFKGLIPISTPRAIAASFTAAGWVRRGLESSSFRVEKRLGFANKRECIRVHFPE